MPNNLPNNLNDAFIAAKNNRKVLSKHIIWESGVSKSQFYRIIKGQEAPSSESKQKISEAFEIDSDQFDLLQNNSRQAHKNIEIIPDRKKRRLSLLFVLSLALISVTTLTVNTFHSRSNLTADKNVASQEDGTLFIEDVTIPDGSSIPINTTFEKIWRVKNTGNLVWKDRYLLRMTPASSLICSSPSRVPIPETQPGKTIDIAVTFKTPYLPGSCRTDWKTADKDGNIYFPDMHGLYSIVVVVAE